MHKLSFLLLLSYFVVSCGFQNKLDTNLEPFIGQEGVQSFSLDNISINADSALDQLSLSSDRTYIRIRLTLSRGASSQVIEIQGRYDELLSSEDIANLNSVGLESPSAASTKGDLSNLVKNSGASESLSYNVLVDISLFSDQSLNNKIVDLNQGIIFVGGDGQTDGEAFRRVPGKNYFLTHEWVSTEISAVEVLPEGNLRKVFLGNTPTDRWDTIAFSTVAPMVNNHPVGYAVYRSGGMNMYKLSNDGSGIQGWNWTDMGDGLSNAYRFTEYPILAGGESTLIGVERNGGLLNDRMFVVMQWDGAQWVETLLGNALKTKVGGTWDNTNSDVSQPILSPDGKVWLIVNEFTFPATNSPITLNQIINSYVISLDLVNGGDPTDLNDWNTELHTLDISQDAAAGSIRNRFHTGVFHQYFNEDNFQLYMPGYGLGKIIAQNGNYRYIPIGVIPGDDYWTMGEDFPLGLNANGFQQVRLCIRARKSPVDNNIILCQGYSALYQIDTRTDTVMQVLGKNNPTGAVKYSR